MNREIKFRAFDDISGKIIEWKELTSLQNNLRLANLRDETNLKWMQYTGLKDKNGKEIYEVDILSNKWKVEVYCDKNTGAWMVKFNTNPSGNRPKTLYKYLQSRESAGCPEDLEIIGNIYQNPELVTPPYIGTK